MIVKVGDQVPLMITIVFTGVGSTLPTNKCFSAEISADSHVLFCKKGLSIS